MKITIIHQDGCQLCETAIREFTDDGHDVELLGCLSEIKDDERRRNMMADMMCAGGEKGEFPQVFVYDRFIPWEPKKQ